MSIVETLKQKIYEGGQISREEAIALSHASLKELTKAADEIRKNICQNTFDLCPIGRLQILRPERPLPCILS